MKVGCTLISESSLQDCTDDGDNPIKCKKKLVVSLALPANLKAGAESISFLTSAQESASNLTVTFPKIELSLSRTAVYYRYPIFYLSDFNAEPYELIIDGSLANLCDDTFTMKATCGLQKDASGSAIPYSQGFCCDCSMCSAIKVCEPNARSALACNILGAYSSASCLRFGDLWYSGFTIGSASVWFEIELNLTRQEGSEKAEQGSMKLSPDQLGATDAAFGCEAELVGTFSPSVEPQYFVDKMLFVPSSPPNASVVLAGLSEYMIVPDTMITVDGTECNKIGVSYYAFNSQGSRCEMDAGSCLKNQLTDLRASDMSRIAASLAPQYMVSAYGEVSLQEFESEKGSGKNESNSTVPSPYLTYISPAPPETLITLTINADSLQYVLSVASGKIVATHVNHNSVEAMSKNAVLEVEIQNTGDVVSQYTVDVLNCTGGVFPIPGQHISLSPNETVTLVYDVYMQDDANVTATCVVSLLNALMVQVSSTTVSWNVTEIKKTDGAQGGETGENGPTKSTTAKGNCNDCSFINILCIVENKCFSEAGGFFGVILGLIAGVVLLILFRSKLFWFLKQLCGCCCGCFGKNSKRRKNVPCMGRDGSIPKGEISSCQVTQERASWKNDVALLEGIQLRSSGSMSQKKMERGHCNGMGLEQCITRSSEYLGSSISATDDKETVRERIFLGGDSGDLRRQPLYNSLRRRVPIRKEDQEGMALCGNSPFSSMRALMDVDGEDGGHGVLTETENVWRDSSHPCYLIPDRGNQIAASLSHEDLLYRGRCDAAMENNEGNH